MKKLVVLAVLLALCASALAIKPLPDQRPSNVPADAQVKTGADESDAPKLQTVLVNLTIERIVPAAVFAGDVFNVTLKVSSRHKSKLNILVVDPQRSGVSYIGGPEPYIIRYEGLEVPLFRWKETISPGQTKEYSYQVKAGSPGTITFPPATVNDDYGNTFETTPAFVQVMCMENGACDQGENYVFCPQDCPTGSKDDTCDAAEDGRIDPDCAPGADPDSITKETATTLPATKPLNSQNNPTPCNPFALPLTTLLLAAIARKII